MITENTEHEQSEAQRGEGERLLDCEVKKIPTDSELREMAKKYVFSFEVENY